MFICHSQLYDDLLVRIKNARAREATKAARQLEVRCSVVLSSGEMNIRKLFVLCFPMIFETIFFLFFQPCFSETVTMFSKFLLFSHDFPTMVQAQQARVLADEKEKRREEAAGEVNIEMVGDRFTDDEGVRKLLFLFFRFLFSPLAPAY